MNWRCVNSTPISNIYNYVYTLNKVTSDNKTLLILEIIFDTDVIMTMDQKKHTDFERRDFLKQLDIYLEKDIKDLFQYESILIKSSLEKLWRVVSNWVEFSSSNIANRFENIEPISKTANWVNLAL